jgi:hypothetical protein
MGVVTLTGAACTITTPTRWTAAIYVANCDVNVQSTLQIDPGVIVKFANGKSMTVATTGTVTASGTAAAPISFTSVKDDSTGGDTNGDGAVTAPAGGDWDGIRLRASGSSFDRCHFRYAGGSDSPALVVDGTFSTTVTNSIFAYHLTATDTVDSSPALDASGAKAGTVITGNVFYGNRVPLAINTTFSIDDSNSFDNSAAAPTLPQPNKYNGIVVAGCGHVAADVTWAATKVPLIVGDSRSACNYLVIDPAAQLTLGDKTIMKFFSDGRITVQGLLTANATSAIVFTSIRDDAHGGDTNGDGSTTAPAGSNWGGISVAASGSVFNKTQFLYAGSSDTSALATNGAYSITVTNSVFAHDRTITETIRAPAALDASSAKAGTVITGNTFYDNTVPLAINTTFSLDDSNIFDNSVAAPASPQPSKYNGIMAAGCGHVASNITWSPTKVAVVVGDPVSACNYLVVDGGGQLTLGSNVGMKFFMGGRITVNANGVLTPGTGVVFTSVRDDTVKGDTNGDGTGTAPAASDWSGIELDNVCQTWASITYSTPDCN